MLKSLSILIYNLFGPNIIHVSWRSFVYGTPGTQDAHIILLMAQRRCKVNYYKILIMLNATI